MSTEGELSDTSPKSKGKTMTTLEPPNVHVNKRSRRAPHTKKRTGCLTCKTRRVRCDEKVPMCANCENAGRICQGYVFPTILTRTRKKCGFRAFKYNHQAFPPQNIVTRATTAQESRALEYFVTHTIPSLQGYFLPNIWTEILLGLRESQPALRHCCLALGSLHATLARHEARAKQIFSPNGLDLVRKDPFATRHYATSLKLLRNGIKFDDLTRTELRLACILLMIYESLHGRRQEMILHLRMGLSLIEGPELESSTDAEVERIFSILGFSHALYGRPRILSSPEVQSLRTAYYSSHVTEFTSFSQARWNTHLIMKSILSYAHTCDTNTFEYLHGASEARVALVETLSRWSWNLEHHRTQTSHDSASVSVGYNLLRAQCEMGFVFLHAYTAHEGTPIRYDACLPNFEKIVKWLEDVIARTFAKADSSARVFSVGLSIIPLLFYTALKCRHPAVRRRAVELLSKVPRFEVAWDAGIAAKAAEAVIEFEEQYLVMGEDGVSFSIPAESRIHSVDIQESEDSEDHQRIAILNWKPNGPAAPFEQRRVNL